MAELNIENVLLYAAIILILIYLLKIYKIDLFSQENYEPMYKSSRVTTPNNFNFAWNERSDKRKDIIGNSNLNTNNSDDNNVIEINQIPMVPSFNQTTLDYDCVAREKARTNTAQIFSDDYSGDYSE